MLKIQDRNRLNPYGRTDEEGVETVLDTGVKVFLTKRVQHVFSENDGVVVQNRRTLSPWPIRKSD